MDNSCLGFDPSDPEYAYLGHFRQDKFLRAGHNTNPFDDSADQYNQTAENYGGAAQAPGTVGYFGSTEGNPL